MKGQRALQAVPSPVEQPRRHAHIAHQSSQPGIPDSPFLTLDEGARYCRFEQNEYPAEAFRRWLHRHAVPIKRAGRKLLIERRVLDVVLAKLG